MPQFRIQGQTIGNAHHRKRRARWRRPLYRELSDNLWTPEHSQDVQIQPRIILAANQRRIPGVYFLREFAEAGGLASYGVSLSDAYGQAGVYAGKILSGIKPADLPVVQSTKFDLVINLKTAKMLDLTIPPTLLATADEVIE
jgi:ABC-type uncharacterized transport system substrate-binding protein